MFTIRYDPAFGARPVKRAVQHLLETALAQAILRGEVREDQTAVVGVSGDDDARKLFVTKIDAPAPTFAPQTPAYDPYDHPPQAPPQYSPSTQSF